MGAPPGILSPPHDYCGEPIDKGLKHYTHREQFLVALWGSSKAPYVAHFPQLEHGDGAPCTVFMSDFLDASSAHVHFHSSLLHPRYIDENYQLYFTFLQTRIDHFFLLSPQPGIQPKTYGGLADLVDFTRRHTHMSVHDIRVEIRGATNALRTSDGVTVGEVRLPFRSHLPANPRPLPLFFPFRCVDSDHCELSPSPHRMSAMRMLSRPWGWPSRPGPWSRLAPH